jgi:hypothetical protein
MLPAVCGTVGSVALPPWAVAISARSPRRPGARETHIHPTQTNLAHLHSCLRLRGRSEPCAGIREAVSTAVSSPPESCFAARSFSEEAAFAIQASDSHAADASYGLEFALQGFGWRLVEPELPTHRSSATCPRADGTRGVTGDARKPPVIVSRDRLLWRPRPRRG